MSSDFNFQSFHERVFGKTVSKAEDHLLSHKGTNTVGNKIIDAQRNSNLYKRKADSDERDEEDTTGTLGKGWFNLKPMDMTEELKRDIQVIQMRNYLDPKRFYKNSDKMGPILHVGTVIEGPTEYKSSRLTKRQRKQSILEEVMTDHSIKRYSQRVFADIQHVKQDKKKFGGNHHKKKPRQKLRALF